MIIELAEAKTLLGINTDTWDSTITKMLNATTSMFERFAQRHLEDYAATEIIDGHGAERIYLKEQPRSITSIHVSADQVWDSGTLIESDGYDFDHVHVVRLGGNVWNLGLHNIRVVYQAGFANVATDAPDVWWAAQKTIQKMWSTLRSEQSYDIDVVSSDAKVDKTLDFRNPMYLDAEVRNILRKVAPWRE